MAFWNKTQPVRPLPNINTHSTRSAAVILMDAVRALPSQAACNAIYTALADKNDLNAADLEELSNRLGRMAWDKARI